MNKKQFGLGIIIISCIFAYMETMHFGYNMFPSSAEEAACDVVSLLLFISGCLLYKEK